MNPMKTKLHNRLIVLLLATALPGAVLASSDTDSKIENAAESSYNFRSVLNNEVNVKAQDGVVTLTGTVQDQDAKELAEDTVASLPGVKTVHNEIAIDAQYPKYSDAWIAWKIRGTLLVKGNVSATDTNVDVKDGVVTLTGTVENAAQKDLTAAYAKEVDHVKSVDNRLVVKAPAADDRTDEMETAGGVIDDASITTQVKYALMNNSSTSALKTHVDTDHGVVIITGQAANEAEKSLVTKLAKEIRGVKSVSNDMTVKMED
jgi:osmotically-inducible protein OsmY